MHRHIVAIILLAGIVITACNKKKKLTPEEVVEVGDARVTMVNKLPDSVYISLSGSDILTGTVPHIFNLSLAGNDSIVLTREQLRNEYSYNYEWHTADYRVGSWMLTGPNGKPQELFFEYKTTNKDDEINLNGKYRTELLVCLDGDGISSTWKAIDAFDANGNSVWGSLENNEQQHTFIISRYHTVEHLFKDTANKDKSTNLAFTMDMSQARVFLGIAHSSDSFVLTNNLTPVAALSTVAYDELYYSRKAISSTGTDTFPEPYYKLVRQSVEK